MSSQEAQQLLAEKQQDLIIVDVRQPAEYQEGHLPSAHLIPLPLLSTSLGQLNPQEKTLVYCRSGGRSRVASQMLVDAGFTDVINLEGGMLAWHGIRATGGEDQGIPLFADLNSLEDILKTAYSLEEGLQDFYLTMMRHAYNPQLTTLFRKLSDIEEIHKERIYEEYRILTGKNDRQAFEDTLRKDCMEGGLSTEEYLNLFQPDMEDPIDIISLAMSIEAQAEDLYSRAARLATIEENRAALLRIAGEEIAHLKQLGTLLEDLMK